MDSYEKSKSTTVRYHKVKKLLKKTYGYTSFRPEQYRIINSVINGEDVCAVLPTGYGKSICFQMPALYLEKPAIIISPLISLMDDQRLILEKLGLTSCCYNSNVSDKYGLRKEILKNKYQFVYITPEAVVSMESFITEMADTTGISLIAIDEAHCISAYGFDFRKSYREITFFKSLLPDVPIVAVTATATNVVCNDICKVLSLDCKPIKTSFDRPNLYLEINEKSRLIDTDIIPIVKKHTGVPIIIYCLTKKETAKVAEVLTLHKIECGVYHSDIPTDKKFKTHSQFIKGKLNIVVATIAFGMGINKSDVRVVIHYGAPRNLEGYYQEIGRAGRDGKKSWCYTFYSFRDFKINESFILASRATSAYQQTQLKLLETLKKYICAGTCRRQILLEYFDEDFPSKCGFCDNCTGKTDVSATKLVVKKTVQNVEKEAKLIIGLIESMGRRSFGMGQYINILRGSNNKSIQAFMKKLDQFGKGKHRSVNWWKEMIDGLVSQQFLQLSQVKGRFGMQVLKTTSKGIEWQTSSDLGSYFDLGNTPKLAQIEMTTTC